MSDKRVSSNVAGFPVGYRASGILLHITSLPSPYGIGDMGPTALSWIDRLAEAGQTYWQFLPLGPSGFGGSPYSSSSSFACNWLLISPDELIADGLLQQGEVAGCLFSRSTVDYDAVRAFKDRLLHAVCDQFDVRSSKNLKSDFETFCREHAHWLDDYALFEALKTTLGGNSYLDWPQELVQRKPAALNKARRELAQQIDRYRLAQFLLFRQGKRLKKYAEAREVRLIGDLPFFVASDSCDVWANPELFLLNRFYRPQVVAGVPPDYFAAHGQLWGNPVYNWEAIRDTGYRWCIDRICALLSHVDLIRLDHFRGFAAAWHVSANAKTARSGKWVPGPDADFFCAIEKELGILPFIAEDLGLITPDVHALRDRFHLPGTRVLQFAFDGRPDNPYLPQNFVPNTVVYTGTHDNNTTRGWYEELSAEQQEVVCRNLHRTKLPNAEAARALIQQASSSVAALAIVPLQDLLNLGAEARMNIPGQAEGNWCWRCTDEMLSESAMQWLQELTTIFNRLPACKIPPLTSPVADISP